MDVVKTLPAGTPGTRRYTQQFGDKLVCVRYRKDPAGQHRLTTVEIVVDEAPLLPPRRTAGKTRSPAPNQHVLLKVAYREEELRRRIKQAGGRWLPDERLWSVPYRVVKALQIESRVVQPAK
jgi:hypothetical protein